MVDFTNEDRIERAHVRQAIRKSGKLDAKVHRLRSGYGYEIEWNGGEQCTVALVSWGQDGSARLTMARTAVDGGEVSRDREFAHSGNYRTPEALANAIAANL
jgi:hypothetical protein